jgi:hypothetical protein
MQFSKKDISIYLIGSFVLGALVGSLDYYFNQMMLITILIFVPNAILGYIQPRLAWLNALSCYIGFVLLEMILGPGLGILPVRWPYFDFLAVFVTPIPAFIGSYWGAAMRWIRDAARRLNQK